MTVHALEKEMTHQELILKDIQRAKRTRNVRLTKRLIASYHAAFRNFVDAVHAIHTDLIDIRNQRKKKINGLLARATELNRLWHIELGHY